MQIVPVPGRWPRRSYNCRMSASFPCLLRPLLALSCLAAAAALAEQPPAQPRDAVPPPGGGTEQTIERIRHEDAGARIDELRVGGETKNITVSPKGKAPAYEVAPESNNRNPASTERERSGSGGWNIFMY